MVRRNLVSATFAVVAMLGLAVAARAASLYKFDGRWGSYGTGPLQFKKPTALTVDSDGRVYVVDKDNHRVQRLNADMSFHSEWGGLGSADGQFSYPWGIALSSERKLYVSDTSGSNNNRIQIFQLTGFFLSKFGGYGSSTGKFNAPRGMAFDDSDNIYVVEYGNNRLQKFDKNGTFITTWGGAGSGDTQMNHPCDVAWGAGGYVFIADEYNHRVVKYTSTGTFVAKWGSNGSNDGQFKYPMGIEVGPDNMVYVTDNDNNRIQKFDADGNLQYVWGQYGSGDGQMNGPCGIHVDSQLRVWVTEYDNNRIQRFRVNKRPSAPTKVTIKPLPAYDSTDLTANATGSTDDDGDPISYRYQWWKSEDGTTFTAGPTLKVLKNTETTVGQFWKVQAWAYDGVSRSAKIYSDVVEIRPPNTKPTAPTSVVITPKNPTDNDELKATATGATDADGDTLVYRYRWQRSTDGTTWTNGPAKRILPASETSVGEWWRCQARAYDGTAVGPIKTSAKVQIRSGSASALTLTATAQGGEVSQIVVSLSAAANVRATITNMAGIVVAELPARDLEAGVSALSWNGVGTSGSKVPGGVYLVRVTAATADGTQTGVLVPLRR